MLRDVERRAGERVEIRRDEVGGKDSAFFQRRVRHVARPHAEYTLQISRDQLRPPAGVHRTTKVWKLTLGALIAVPPPRRCGSRTDDRGQLSACVNESTVGAAME